MIRRPPRSPLFPYTPLSRSRPRRVARRDEHAIAGTRQPSHGGKTDPAAPSGDHHDAHRGTIRSNSSAEEVIDPSEELGDRKSTRLNSSHSQISYAVFCLKKK